MRLNRFIANAGVCSRREADTYIEAGVVTINGKPVNDRITSYNVCYTKLLRMLTWTHRITFLQGESNRVMKRGEQIQVIVQDFDSETSKAFIEDVVTEVYRIEAKMHLPKRLSVLAAQHGFSFSKMTIRDNRRNWGSCSSQNNISLNLQMMKLPEELIDYILLHELVHTEIKNHGPKFWQRLDEVSNGQALV